MKRPSMLQVWYIGSILACIAIEWLRLEDLGASEFRGGRVTGTLLSEGRIGAVLLFAGLLIAAFRPKVAVAISTLGCLALLPLYLYFLFPGVFQRVFPGNQTVVIQTEFAQSWWPMAGIVSLIVLSYISFKVLLAAPSGS